MKASFIKDQKIRNKIKKNELSRQFLKSIVRTENLNLNIRRLAQIKLDSNKNRSITRVRNRCVLSYRGRRIEKNLKISRMNFRKYVRIGKLPGIKKAI
mgnify:CR=1 FL=1